ncbi:MAG: 3-beta hydroxysteroid dehydrogenase [Hoeflea sp.]|nr:MAG: 3-beta hydroxysteroid dehydrogenase [Hoeflea sp.]
MRIALVGATGQAGSRILKELTDRGHNVTGIVRNPDKVPTGELVTAVGTDSSRASLANAIKGHDAVVTSVRFLDLDPDILVPAVIDSGVKRYVIVGGAGSLIGPSGVPEVDDPNFPPAFRPNSARGAYMLDLLKQTEGLDWTYISPSRMFVAGERTGTFRYGKDHLLFNEAGDSRISFEDFAIAVADELEAPKYVGQRFTIGY